MGQYYVYIVANENRTTYTGVTNDLPRRVAEHKSGGVPGFTARYGLMRLVYFESTADVLAAIAREKQIKSWTRAKRLALIASMNPEWDGLSSLWTGGSGPSLRSGRQ